MWEGNDGGMPSDDLVQEQAYLVSRGVRALALLGEQQTEDPESLHQYLIQKGGWSSAIPFVLPSKQAGWVRLGYAAEQWVIDLLRWIDEVDAPERWAEGILGLLLGYSPSEVERFLARRYSGNSTAALSKSS